MLGCGVNGVATLDCVFPLLSNVIYWLLVFAGVVALILIIISGVRFITSGGDAKTVETAKKSLTFAILGLVLVFLAFLILNTIAYVTGVACLSDITKGIPTFQSCQKAGDFVSCPGGETCEMSANDCTSIGGSITAQACTSNGISGNCCATAHTGGCPSGQTCELSVQDCKPGTLTAQTCSTISGIDGNCCSGGGGAGGTVPTCSYSCVGSDSECANRGGTVSSGTCNNATFPTCCNIPSGSGCPTGDQCRTACFSFETTVAGQSCTLTSGASGACCSSAH